MANQQRRAKILPRNRIANWVALTLIVGTTVLRFTPTSDWVGDGLFLGLCVVMVSNGLDMKHRVQ